jgi:hypothetical protein
MATVNFQCDLSQQGTALLHCWEHTVGSCHAPIALRADWQQQLRRCQAELGFRYVRFHGLLSDDVGTVVEHNDELLYSFFNADQIVDFLVSIGMRPFVELSFMPMETEYGLVCSINPTFPSHGSGGSGWISQNHFALDQGPVILMVENYRSGLIWRLMRSCPYVAGGLRRAGFRGGWLTGLPPNRS